MKLLKRWRNKGDCKQGDKYIFLDIDGVLNSSNLFEKILETNQEGFMGLALEESSLALLAQIVERTGAKIILSSSWRYDWERENAPGSQGELLNQALAHFGLEIIDKTPSMPLKGRQEEIREWMHGKDVGAFVILDDGPYDWEKYGYDRYWVRTYFLQGGLNQEGVDKAVKLLGEK